VRRERLSRDDLARLAASRPPRKVHRDAPELPIHYRGFTEPAPCGLPVGAWAARTNRPDLVTCPSCQRLRRVILVAGAPGVPLPPAAPLIEAVRSLAVAAHLTP
jgi:hypothetical protein